MPFAFRFRRAAKALARRGLLPRFGIGAALVLGPAPHAAAAPFVLSDADFEAGVYELRYYAATNELFLNGVATALDADPLDDLFLANASNAAAPAWDLGSDFGAAFLQAPVSFGTSAEATMGWDLRSVSRRIARVEVLAEHHIFQFVPWNDEALGDSVFGDVATPDAFGAGPYTNLYTFTSDNADGTGPGSLGSEAVLDVTPQLPGAWLADPGLLELRFGYELLDTDIPRPHLQLFRDNFAGFPANDGFLLRITLSLDPFLCYKARTAKGTPAFEARDLTLADALETRETEVGAVKALCNPADKNGEGISDPDTHFVSHAIKSSEKHAKATGIAVSNQLGSLTLDTKKEDRLLVPSTKGFEGAPTPPEVFPIDHFKCYKAKLSKGAEVSKGVQVTLSDQFDPKGTRTFDVKKPRHLCFPVDKNGEGIQDAGALLVCYPVKPAKGETRHTKRSVFVGNQFGSLQLDTVKEEELCVPSAASQPELE